MKHYLCQVVSNNSLLRSTCSVLSNISASTYPVFRHCLIHSLPGTFPITLRIYLWLMLSNASLMAGASTHSPLPCPLKRYHSYAMALWQLRPAARNRQLFDSKRSSQLGSRAFLTTACITRYLIVEIPVFVSRLL